MTFLSNALKSLDASKPYNQSKWNFWCHRISYLVGLVKFIEVRLDRRDHAWTEKQTLQIDFV